MIRTPFKMRLGSEQISEKIRFVYKRRQGHPAPKKRLVTSFATEDIHTCPSRFLASLLSPSDEMSGLSTAADG